MTSTAGTGALDAAFLTDFAQRWLDAWNAHDGDAVAALCTDDVEIVDPGAGTLNGRTAVAAWVEGTARAFPDFAIEALEPGYAAPDSPKAIGPWRMTGTNTGPIEPPGFAATGKPFTLEGVDHWTFRDGLMAHCRLFYDVNALMQQLGLTPAAGSKAEHAMVLLQRTAMKAAAAASDLVEKSKRGDSARGDSAA